MVVGAIWDNPILIFMIISLISWFFGRNKEEEQKNNQPTPQPTEEADRRTENRGSEKPVMQRAGTDEEIRRKIQERERQLKKKLSQTPQLERKVETLAQSIKEQYERQKAKLADSQPKEKPPEPAAVSVPVQMARKAIPQELQPKNSSEVSESARPNVNLREVDLRQAIIMSEILGPPRSKRKPIR